jgi:hypothetical protein
MTAEISTLSQEVTPPSSLRQGYDSVTGGGRSIAVLGDAEEKNSESTVQVTVATSIYELAAALQVDQSLSVSYGPVASGDEKLQFMRNLDITNSSVSVVVYSKHVSRVESVSNASLDPDVAREYGFTSSTSSSSADPSNKDIVKFFNGYGDSFISQRTLGGEYYAVFTFFASDVQEQTKVKGELKAGGIYSGVSATGELQTEFSKVVKTSTTRTDFSQKITGIENPVFPSSDNIVDYAIKFPSISLDTQHLIDFTVTRYENVPGLSAMSALADSRTHFIGDGTGAGLAGKLVQLVTLRNTIASLLKVYQAHGGFSDEKLVSVQGEVESDITAVNDQITKWERNPTQVFPALALPSLSYGVPSLSISVGTWGPYGGPGGGWLDDVSDPRDFVASGTRIASIGLRAGDYVDALLVTYVRDGGDSWTVQHGGNGGGDMGTLYISPDDAVTSVSGKYFGYVLQLSLSTANSTVQGGSGRAGRGIEGGGAFSHTMPDGNFLVGFRGAAGPPVEYLDRIMFVYAGFKPAVWTR